MIKPPVHPKDRKVSDDKLRKLFIEGKKYYLTHLNNLPKDLVITNIRGFDVFTTEDQVIEAIVTEKSTTKVHKAYDDYVELNGKIYHYKSKLIVSTIDTNNYILRENAYKTYRGYYEKNKDLIKNERLNYWIPKEYAVITEDTKEPFHKNEIRTRGGRYYKYIDMAYDPDDWGHAPYTNEPVFPKNIKERRIGVEYEFTHSYKMFKPFLAGDYKEIFSSVRDGSLDQYRQGIEFVSIPLKLEQLKMGTDFITFAKQHGANIASGCGYHVHIGASDFSFMDISRLVTLALSVESQMFQLGGTDRQKSTYCKKLTERFHGFQDIVLPKDKNKVGESLYSGMNSNFDDRHKRSKYVDARGHAGVRYYWFNIDRFFYKREEPEQKTVEFRNHEATWDADAFHNFSLLCYYIVEFAKNHSKETCSKANLYDVVKTSQLKHRRQLKQYLNQKL